MILPCLTPSTISCIPRIMWSNLGKGIAPSPTPWCSSYWKGSFRVSLDYGHQRYYKVTNLLPHRVWVNVGIMATEGCSLHSPNLFIESFTIRSSLLSYQKRLFFAGESLCKWYSRHILSPTDRAEIIWGII